MPPYVQIVAMRSWGELGNLLAARTLAAALVEPPDGLRCEVFEAEHFLPRLADVGSSIHRIAAAPLAPAERHRSYLQLMAELEPVVPPQLEMAATLDAPLAAELAPLADHFATSRPDLVVGTKGIISRLCLAALRAAGRGATPVVNFVTNQGLLALPLHRSTAVDWHLVPTPAAWHQLVERHGFDPQRVRLVGRLIARTSLGQFFEQAGAAAAAAPPGDGGSPVRLGIFCNRGGAAYLDLLTHLAVRRPQVDLVFIGYNDAPLVAAARELQARHRLAGWQVFDRLEQGSYLRYLAWLAGAPAPLLISKTGPNTMLEATYFGIPTLMLASGLPMESWVGPHVEETGVGRACDTMDELIAVLDGWLARPEEIAARRRRAQELARTEMDQQRVRATLRATFREVLAGEPTTAAPAAASRAESGC